MADATTVDRLGVTAPIIAAIEIRGLAATTRSNWSFLRVETDRGRVGWGELTLRSHEGVLAAMLAQLQPALVGRTTAELAPMRRAYPSLPSGRVGNTLFSALDQALTDLEAQEAGVPVYAYLGAPQPRPLAGYATVNRSVTSRTPEGFAAAAAAAVAAGFTGVKIMPFDSVTPATSDGEFGRVETAKVLDRIAAVRATLGSSIRLMVDCHWRLSEAAALRFIEEVAPFRLHWLECPVPESAEWFPAIRRIRRRANERGMLLAGAENIVGVSGATPFLHGGLYDVIMPDIKYCGGYGEFGRIVAAARQAGVAASPHNPSGPVAHAHTVHACIAFGVEEPVEQQFAESPLFDDAVRGMLAPALDGAFHPPRGAGLGIGVDERVLSAHPAVPVPLSLADPSFA